MATSTAKFMSIDRWVAGRLAAFLDNQPKWRVLGRSSSRIQSELAAAGLHPICGAAQDSAAVSNARRSHVQEN